MDEQVDWLNAYATNESGNYMAPNPIMVTPVFG
jgi:hypothetical protein